VIQTRTRIIDGQVLVRLVTHKGELDLIGTRDAFAIAVGFGSIPIVDTQNFSLLRVVEGLESLLLCFITAFMKAGIPFCSIGEKEGLSTMED
jgi:hypothetical protein